MRRAPTLGGALFRGAGGIRGSTRRGASSAGTTIQATIYASIKAKTDQRIRASTRARGRYASGRASAKRATFPRLSSATAPKI